MFNDGAATDLMPWGAVIALALVLTGAGVLVVLIGRRATRGDLPLNYLLGIRTTATLASVTNWDAAHRAAGPDLQRAGLGPLVVGPLLLVRPSNWVGLVLVVLALAWLVGWILKAGSEGRRAIASVDG